MPKKAYSKGSKKALASMVKRYGKKKGTSVFYAKANKYGKGKSNAKKANSVYSKGSHRVKRAKRGRRKKR
jgi:hypothetical protein